MLFEQWKNTSFIHSSYLLMFSLRDILLNIVISTLFDHPLIQAIFFMIITTSFLLYLVIYLPFKKNYENFQQIFLEIIVMLTYLSALIMTATQSTTYSQAIKDSLGQFIMIMAIIFNVAIMAFVVWEILVLSYSIYIAFKEWRKRSRSKKIQPHLKEIDLIYKQKKDDHSFTSSQMTIDNSLKEKSENFSDPQTSVPYYPWRMGFNYYERKRVNRPTRFPSWQENIFYQSAEQQTSNYGLSEETNSINHDQNFLELKEKSRRNDTTLYDQIVSKIEQKIDESNSFGSESIQKEIVESKSDSGEFENDNKVQKKTILKRRRTPFNQPVLDLSEISPHR